MTPAREEVEREDDEAHLAAASTAGRAAGVTSSLWRCLPNRQGSERSCLWSAFMFCMEIPPHLEKNMYVHHSNH
jgi:hypothetical protein